MKQEMTVEIIKDRLRQAIFYFNRLYRQPRTGGFQIMDHALLWR